MAIDEDGKRVVFEGWGEIKGASAKLIIVLARPFRQAMRDELAPEHYPFLETSKFMRQINCESDEALRRRILRCRNKINQLSRAAGATTSPSMQ